MAEPIHYAITKSLQEAEGLYHSLVLLVGDTGSGKTRALRTTAEVLGSTVVNVNLLLSRELLVLTEKQRPLQLRAVFDQIAIGVKPPLVLDNLEILFDKRLKQDPLRLLQDLSRNQTVVASWNGRLDGGRLYYAEIGHPEFRRYDPGDTLIVAMDGQAAGT